MTKSYLSHLQCSSCGTRHSFDKPINNTCADGGILDCRYDIERARAEITKEDIARGPASLWRYAPMLPAQDPANAVTLSEGWTPLLRAPGIEKALGCREIWIKDEGRNPSGTFKDRGATVAATRFRELGIKTMVHNSSGNAGGAWALYCARAGIGCVNLLAEDTLPSSLQQSSLAGAKTYVLQGHWKHAGPMVAKAAEAHGWFLGGTLKEPYRLEGKKTMGWEIAEQLGWEFPDAVFYPTGGGVGAIGIFKAFGEIEALGWAADQNRKPRLIVTQYEGCAPMVKAFEEGKDETEPWEDMDVLPGGLKSVKPPGDRDVLRILRETGGTAFGLSTEASLDAVKMLAREEGIFSCPESATTLAGLIRALEKGDVDKDERIVLTITGSGLKSLPTLPAPDTVPIAPGAGIPA
ncbi:MAG: threonine synthase [Rhodospirillales bacterium]